jgi:hypothetical protein
LPDGLSEIFLRAGLDSDFSDARADLPDGQFISLAVAIFTALRLDIRKSQAYFPRPSRALGSRANMSSVMQHGWEKLVRLSNGFRPIDSARLTHGSDLA